MATVKVYECPRCQGRFTTSKIKSNKGRCPECQVLLKHEIDRSQGKMVHMWIIDDNPSLPIEIPVEPKFEKISDMDVHPEVYKSKVFVPHGDPLYRVVYYGRYGDTHLRCPKCGQYLHTTNMISGSRQTAFCRGNNDKYSKCKTRTEFFFFKFGEVFNANNY